MTATMWALILAPVFGPILGYLIFRGPRGVSRWLWKHMPDGRLKSLLLRRVGSDKPTWPPLPPGP